jgi:esterase/lipase superfamily enzyme
VSGRVDLYVVSCRKRDPRLAGGGSPHERSRHTPKRAGTYALLRAPAESQIGHDDLVAVTADDTDPGERPGRQSIPGLHAEWREAQRAAEDRIANRLAALGPLALYVHGFNTKPKEAVQSALRIQEHLDRSGVAVTVVAFQWPSAGHLADYFPDQRAAGQFGSYALVNLLLSLQRRTVATPVHCIAHSMGTYVVTRALSTITTLHLDLSLPAGRRPLAQVAYMQPDIDFDILCSGYAGPAYDSPSYLEIADGYGATEMAERLTIYCTTNDMALFASLFKNRSKRLGAYGPGLEGVSDAKIIMETRVRQNVHVVNCDEWCVFDLSPNHSHSHFLECPRMMDDVAGVLRGMPAGEIPARAQTPAPRWYRLTAARHRPGVLLAMAAWWRGLGSFGVNPIAVFLIKWKKRVQTYWRWVKGFAVVGAAGGTGIMAWLTQRPTWLGAAGLAAVGLVVYVPVWLGARGVQRKQDA